MSFVVTDFQTTIVSVKTSSIVLPFTFLKPFYRHNFSCTAQTKTAITAVNTGLSNTLQF